MFNKDTRFKIKHKEGLGGFNICILVDTQTGVNYIMSGMASAITPLLDENGNVVIDKKG